MDVCIYLPNEKSAVLVLGSVGSLEQVGRGAGVFLFLCNRWFTM